MRLLEPMADVSSTEIRPTGFRHNVGQVCSGSRRSLSVSNSTCLHPVLARNCYQSSLAKLQLMRIFFALVLLVFGANSLVLASVILEYMAAYECNAVAINRGIVGICGALRPELASRSLIAYAIWIERNSHRAIGATNVCSSPAVPASNDDLAKDKHEYFKKRVTEVTSELLADFERDVLVNGAGKCNVAIEQLGKVVVVALTSNDIYWCSAHCLRSTVGGSMKWTRNLGQVFKWGTV